MEVKVRRVLPNESDYPYEIIDEIDSPLAKSCQTNSDMLL